MKVQISSGRGPAECEMAVGLYLEVFLKEHPKAILEQTQGGWSYKEHGHKIMAYKSLVLTMPEDEQAQEGIIRWICQSPLRPQHRRKNWFIEITAFEQQPHVLSQNELDIHPDKHLLKIDTFRSPGKGGQNVNKVETGVRITHLPTGLVASSTTARTQGQNRKLAMERLSHLIEEQIQKSNQQIKTASWQQHDQLKRGEAFASFTGLDFSPSDPQ